MNKQEAQMMAKRLQGYKKSPFPFIKDMFGIVPLKDNERFKKGTHMTEHQRILLQAVEDAVNDRKQRRISIRSGHGVGKSSSLAWLVIWFLFSFDQAQIPCTAPSAEQMHDVLWKEISKWLKKMPESIAQQFEWTAGHIRIKDSPETWFARAKTARKESPEALAGIHGDHVMFAIDEASAVPEEIFTVAEGALTEENILVVMISNPTRLNGYFYDTHHRDREAWQTFHFNSDDSPLVSEKYVKRITERYGADSDEFRVRVQGDFPREDAIDDKGFVPLLKASDLHKTINSDWVSSKRMGIDPSGGGDNETVWVVRDKFKAKIYGREKNSDEMSIAQKSLTIMKHEKIEGHNVYVDNFGVGANVAQAIARGGEWVQGVNVGDKADDDDRYSNLRAEAYFRMKEWLRKGGELVMDDGWDQLLTIKYKRTLQGKIQMMSKDTMRREGIRSPDIADALSLTFVDPELVYDISKQEKEQMVREQESFDKFDPI